MIPTSQEVYLPTLEEFTRAYNYRAGKNVPDVAEKVYKGLLDEGLTGDIWALVINAKDQREYQIREKCAKCKHFTGNTSYDDLFCFCDYAPKMKIFYCKPERSRENLLRFENKLCGSRYSLFRWIGCKWFGIRFHRSLKKCRMNKEIVAESTKTDSSELDEFKDMSPEDIQTMKILKGATFIVNQRDLRKTY